MISQFRTVAAAALAAWSVGAMGARGAGPDDAGALAAKYYPPVARDAGSEGVATVGCLTNGHLALKTCALISEFPPGQGFGKAALAMAALSPDQPAVTIPPNMNPVAVTVHFTQHPLKIEPNLLQPRHLVVNPTIVAAPDAQEWAAVYPTPALANRLIGQARLRCGVTKMGSLEGCVIDQETPVGYGFGAAALKLAPDFKLKPRTLDGVPVDGAVVLGPLAFDPPPVAPIERTTLSAYPRTNPSFRCTGKKLDRYYPEAAERMAAEGRAIAACRFTAAGVPTECTWIDEMPAGLGFGLAGSRVACEFRLKPLTLPAGQTQAVIETPVSFKAPL